MTRANINYIYQKKGGSPKTLYFYQNGDQYPSGIRDFYNVLDFTDSDWSIKAFKKWLGENYRVAGRQIAKGKDGVTIDAHVETEVPAKPEKRETPCIFYDDAGFTTDYTYVFEAMGMENKVMVYNWGEQIFEGTAKEFKTWIKKQKT